MATKRDKSEDKRPSDESSNASEPSSTSSGTGGGGRGLPTFVPPIATVCPVAPTSCPEIPPICPQPAADAAGDAVAFPTLPLTQCPRTICPQPTECPALPTLCPHHDTVCPPDPTRCPPIPTICPKCSDDELTKGGGAQRPTFPITGCPKTICPSPEGTQCPPTLCKCEQQDAVGGGIGPATWPITQCPLPTVCAPETVCVPPEGTAGVGGANAAAVAGPITIDVTLLPFTICPRQTQCPHLPTLCPSQPTQCPPRITECPHIPTLCGPPDASGGGSAACFPTLPLTQCPQTHCPRITQCPPFATVGRAGGAEAFAPPPASA